MPNVFDHGSTFKYCLGVFSTSGLRRTLYSSQCLSVKLPPAPIELLFRLGSIAIPGFLILLWVVKSRSKTISVICRLLVIKSPPNALAVGNSRL